jgi:hypothetical protein
MRADGIRRQRGGVRLAARRLRGPTGSGETNPWAILAAVEILARRLARHFREKHRRGVVRVLYGPDRKVIAEVRVDEERDE